MIKKGKDILSSDDLIKSRELEDSEMIRLVESALKKKRGYIYKMPKPGSMVVLLLSGGLDSIGMMAILLKKYKLRVFPLFLRRGQKRVGKEERSAKYYVEYFKNKYGKLCEDLFIMDTPIPPNEIRWTLTSKSNQLVNIDKSQQLHGIPVYASSLVAPAVQYAYYLELKKGFHIRNVFCGFVLGDGRVMAYETLTALRILMLQTCILQNDYEWQISSLALEKEIGSMMDKSNIIDWCKSNNIDLSKTWSCYYSNEYHCGHCKGCYFRKWSFDDSRSKDDTIYKLPNLLERMVNWVQKRFNYEKYHQVYT